MDVKIIKKRIASAFTACGWLLGLQAFSSAYYLLTGISNGDNDDVLIGLIGFGIGAIFYWLYKKSKEETSYKNLGALFLLCLGFDVFDMAFFMSEGLGMFLFCLIIRAPICVLLYRGTVASIEQYKKCEVIKTKSK
jgi:hypothetical protein